MELVFNFYGVGVRVSSNDPLFETVLDSLKEDLNYFIKTESTLPAQGNQIEIEVRAPWQGRSKPRGLPLFKTRMCKVYGLGSERTCDYGDGTLIYSKTQSGIRKFTVEGHHSRTAEIYEVAYLALLSSVGEELDLLGYHRIHALGVKFRNHSALILLPSGGGKSAIATRLLNRSDFLIFSDEMPLCRNGIIYPFPIRIALKPKILQSLYPDHPDFRQFKRKIFPTKTLIPISQTQVSIPTRATEIFFGKRVSTSEHPMGSHHLDIPPSNASDSAPEIYGSNSISSLFQLWTHLVVGIGLCQMAEHMLRWGNFRRILRISVSRLREASHIYLQVKRRRFLTSRNAIQNADYLELHFRENLETFEGESLPKVQELFEGSYP